MHCNKLIAQSSFGMSKSPPGRHGLALHMMTCLCIRLKLIIPCSVFLMVLLSQCTIGKSMILLPKVFLKVLCSIRTYVRPVLFLLNNYSSVSSRVVMGLCKSHRGECCGKNTILL